MTPDRLHDAKDSPFLSDTSRAQQAAHGRRFTHEEHLEAAKACIADGEIDIVHEYYIGSGLVFMSQLEASENT